MLSDRHAVSVLSIPANHPYTQAIRPAGVAFLPDPDIDGNWWPHPAYTAQYWREQTQLPDVVHAHFGFEHVTPDEMRSMTAALPVPLVVTVHDVDNPHLEDQAEHHERLRILVQAADEVLTLTDCAAARLADMGVRARVVGHPLVGLRCDVDREPRAAVFLKSLRGNVVADPEFYRAIAREVPMDIYAHDVAATAELRDALDDLDLHVHAPMSDAELHAAVARATVCVLPYTRGTHSGWLEMCRDQGTTVAVPDIGCYASQADTPDAVATYRVGDGDSAARAARELLDRGPVPYAGDRERDLADVRAVHAEIYTRLGGR